MSAPHQPIPQRRPPSFGHRLFLAVTWIFKGLLRVGVPLGPMVLLTVRGRKSGQLRTTPVDLFEGKGHSYLVSTHRQENSNWVLNLRTARGGEIRRGHERWMFTAEELPPVIAGKVLKEVLAPRLALPVRGFVLRRTFPVSPDAPESDFVSAAHDHPVFKIIRSQAT